MKAPLQVIGALILLAIFGPIWLLMICNAAVGDWQCKRRVRCALSSTHRGIEQ
jgi:hypothetical protein